ncbi:hypothetical protein DY000_02061585 [Brassica cretica]|uniref:Secreted protein n=1 Tax=Brassica cretica TaxID=69181 RepID=A0ABQ7AP36_BRACR|nr:hypothetical protein DY000_02061585 [Brassica cretica]
MFDLWSVCLIRPIDSLSSILLLFSFHPSEEVVSSSSSSLSLKMSDVLLEKLKVARLIDVDCALLGTVDPVVV